MDNEDTRVPTVHIESGGPIIDDTQLEHWGATPWPISTRFILENTWRSFSTNSGISQYRLAKVIGTPPRRINEIVHRRRSITADTAVRLGQALGITPEFHARQFRGRRSGS